MEPKDIQNPIAEVDFISQLSTIQLKLKHAWPSTKQNPMWDCTLSEWDLGVSIGSGKTIQEAIEAFFEWEYDMKDKERPNYKWS